jgi:hypothetical protein
MKDVLPYFVAASPAAVIVACIRSMSRERHGTDRDVRQLMAELDEGVAGNGADRSEEHIDS